MSKDLSIIPATENHRQVIVSILQSVALPVVDLPSNLSHFFLAVEGNQILGIVGLEIYGDYGLLRSLAVNPNYRNQHIAQQLILRLEEYSKQLNLKMIYLLTETASRYFEKKGFQTIERDQVPVVLQQSSEFSHVCPTSAIVMKKNVYL